MKGPRYRVEWNNGAWFEYSTLQEAVNLAAYVLETGEHASVSIKIVPAE